MEYEAKRPMYIPATVYLDLELHLMDTRPGVKPEAVVAELVQRWLTIEEERLSLRARGQPKRGFQWKDTFLPEGTGLRTSYRDTVEFAKVVGNRIVTDDGDLMSPSQFANRRAKGRNAWRFVWVRFPGDDYWIRAANCRTRSEEMMQKRSNRQGLQL
jgi:hypothetical protein